MIIIIIKITTTIIIKIIIILILIIIRNTSFLAFWLYYVLSMAVRDPNVCGSHVGVNTAPTMNDR